VNQESASITAPAKEDVESDDYTMAPQDEVKQDETVTTENALVELPSPQESITANITATSIPEIIPLVLSTSPKVADVRNVIPQEETVSSKQEMTEIKLELTTPIMMSDVNVEDEVTERAHEQAVVTRLEVSESVEVVANPMVSTATEIPTNIAYPRLDSLIAGKEIVTIILSRA